MNDLVQFELEDGIALLTINRPKALNALNGAVLEALGAAVSRLEDEESVRCVVVTGAGSKSFVAGADIVAMSELSPSRKPYSGSRDGPPYFCSSGGSARSCDCGRQRVLSRRGL